MKVAHIVWSLTNGGIENMLVDIVRYQVEEAEVHVVVINDNINDSILNRLDKKSHVHIIGRKKGSKNPLSIIKLNYVIWRINPDVLHFHAVTGKYIKVKTKARVFTAHNLSWGEKHVSGMDKCVAISSIVYDNLIKNGYTNAVQIDNGIDFALIRQRNRTYDGHLKIVQTGRLITEYKGQDITIEAIDRLVNQGITNIHVDFMGEGESRKQLEKMIQEKKLESFISLLGDTDRDYIYEHLADYDVFVQPSRWEGFGLTIAEAVAAKLPVVIARHKGPLQIIDGGKFGYVFDIEDVDGLVEMLKDISINYPEKNIQEEAFCFAKDRFSVDKTAKDYLTLYKRIINEKLKV